MRDIAADAHMQLPHCFIESEMDRAVRAVNMAWQRDELDINVVEPLGDLRDPDWKISHLLSGHSDLQRQLVTHFGKVGGCPTHREIAVEAPVQLVPHVINRRDLTCATHAGVVDTKRLD